jgi:hypothetical protein
MTELIAAHVMAARLTTTTTTLAATVARIRAEVTR